MNKILNSMYSLFLVGFILKFFHVHYTALIMLTALGGILIVGLILLFKKEGKLNAVITLGVWAWLTLLLILIKFFPFGIIALVLATVISILAVLLAIKGNQPTKLLLLGACMVTALAFYLTPTHSRFYILNIKWNYEIETDFITLDKYSWFLYQNGQLDEATLISDRALTIAKQSGDEFWVELIEKHNELIREKDWTKFSSH